MLSQRFKKLLLLIGDLAILYVSLWLTLLVRYQTLPDIERWAQHLGPFTVVYLVWVIVFYIAGLYSIAVTRNDLRFFASLFRAMLINAGLAAVFFYLTPFVSISPKTNFVINLILSTALILVWRQLSNRLIGAKNLRLSTLLIGESVQLEELIQELNLRPQLGYKIVKTVVPSEVMNNPEFDLKKTVEQLQIKVIAAEPVALRSQSLVDQLFRILPLKLKVVDLANFSEEVTGKIPINVINQAWFLENLNLASQATYEATKRIFDVVFSIILIIATIWLIPLIALLILVTSGGPVFFKQVRVGLLGKKFMAIKFRTMVTGSDKLGPQWVAKNDSRVTRFGRFLRKVRLDEIPQLYNILRGELSFVGPRPERPELIAELEKVIPFYKERLLVKPGLTGWDQISGEYHSPTREDTMKKLQYDLYYTKNRSLIFDLSIILKTVNTIVTAAGQ